MQAQSSPRPQPARTTPIKIHAETDARLDEVKAATGLPKQEALRKAVAYWAPRVLEGEISLVAKEGR